MIVGVNVLLKYLGLFHGILIILVANSLVTIAFPILTQFMGFYGAIIGRVKKKTSFYSYFARNFVYVITISNTFSDVFNSSIF